VELKPEDSRSNTSGTTHGEDGKVLIKQAIAEYFQPERNAAFVVSQFANGLNKSRRPQKCQA